jgi:hypothetical protein
VPISPVLAAELAQLQRGHRVQHDEDKIVLGSHSRMSTGSSIG